MTDEEMRRDQRTTAEDREGDIWVCIGAPVGEHMTVVGKFNDWCLLGRSWGDDHVGVYPLWWLEECGWKRVRRAT